MELQKERLLVCLGPSKFSERLIRATKKIALETKTEWYAIFVETPKLRLTPEQQEQLLRNYKLVRELGAQVIAVPGENIADTVVEYAKKYNISKIIAGKPLLPRWKEIIRGSIVDQIIRRSSPIDVYVITTSEGKNEFALPSLRRQSLLGMDTKKYLISVGLVILATAIGVPIHWHIAPTNLVMLYLVVVVCTALYLGRGPSILASFLSVLAFNFFMISPHHTFVVNDSEYIITFFALLSVGIIISRLTSSVREQSQVAQKREIHAIELYELSRDLNKVSDLHGIGEKLFLHLQSIFPCEIALFIQQNNSTIKLCMKSDGFIEREQEMERVVWSYKNGKATGLESKNLPGYSVMYLPLKIATKVLGILALELDAREQIISIENRRLLDAYVMITSMTMERVLLTQEAKDMEMLKITEKVQSALLSSISHEFRTPLATITGILSSLQEASKVKERKFSFDEDTKNELIDTAWGEALKLNRLVGNLLEMTRLEAGSLIIKLELNDVEELISEVVRQLSDRTGNNEIIFNIPDDLPLIPFDFVLLSIVLSNIIDNAVKYSFPNTSIEIRALNKRDNLVISVADRGMGIADGQNKRIFEKFYRIKQDESGGTGLGLSISKGIIEAHGGQIWARSRDGGGSIVAFSLPKGDSK